MSGLLEADDTVDSSCLIFLTDGAGGRVDVVHRDCQVYHQGIRNQILEGVFEPTILPTLLHERFGPENIVTRVEVITRGWVCVLLLRS